MHLTGLMMWPKLFGFEFVVGYPSIYHQTAAIKREYHAKGQ